MKEIKDMLAQFAQNKPTKNFGQLLQDLDEKENAANFGENHRKDSDLKAFIAREKAELKELQERLEDDKRQYKQDKRELEELRHTDPSAYRQRSQLLDKVKDSIERQIDKVNQRIAKIKESERSLRK